MTTWVATYENGVEFLENRDGVDWNDAPLPPRLHQCFTQTRGFMSGEVVWRCPCGAISLNSGRRWLEKNSARTYREKQTKAQRPKRWWRR